MLPDKLAVNLLTNLVNLEGMKVKDFRLTEGVGIIIKIENQKNG
jgi:hypothetical protein